MRWGVAILAIGSELLDGRVVDTNSNYLAQKFSDYGVHLKQVLTCDDDLEQIVNALRFLSLSANLIVVSGGLGPTTDDLTRESIAAFCGSNLELRADALEAIKALYRERRREFDQVNTKQAYMPQGAQVIPNDVGTAPGFKLLGPQNTLIVALPGVPAELKRMFESGVLESCLEHLQIDQASRLEVLTLRLFGLPESVIGSRVQGVGLPADIVVSYRAHFPDITVQLKARARSELLHRSVRSCREALGEEFIFSCDPKQSLEEVVAELLTQKKLTLSVAESCTAGMLGALLTNVPGASQYFVGGAQSYSNGMKSDVLGVCADLIKTHGAVSKEVACAMAQGARSRFKSDLALAITGIAGPDGGSAAKPVGTFMIGLAHPHGVTALHYFFASSRRRVREYAAYTALDSLRRYLLSLPYRAEHEYAHAG